VAGGSLEEKIVVVTRPKEQAGELAGMLEDRGAKVLVAPAIRVTPVPARELDGAIDRLMRGGFEWAVFTSPAGVAGAFGRRAARRQRVAPVPASVAAIGEATAKALRDFGIEPDLIPRSFTTESLARAMPRGSGSVLLARADIAPEGLEEALRAKGWQTERIDAYRTTFSRALPAAVVRALREERVDAVTFTSASTVEGFVRLGGPVRGPKVVCIGPVTAAAARKANMKVAAVARPHTIEGLVAALERVLAPARHRPRKEP
jgi:uroporphyrinogen-III synthase